MTVLSILQWIVTSGNIITATVFLTFAFSLLFLLIRGKS